MHFLHTLKRLVYRPDFFRLHEFTFKKALKFYTLLILLAVLLRVLVALPGTLQFVRTVLSEEWNTQERIVSNLFPEELILTITDGAVEVNVPEPFPIALPFEWYPRSGQVFTNLLVIDTTKPIDVGDFEEQDTLFILGERSIGYYNLRTKEYRIRVLGEENFSESLTVNKEEYDAFVKRASSVLRTMILIGTALLPLILFGALFIGKLVYLLFGALVVSLAAWLRGYKLSYGTAYLSSMYLLPIPLLYELMQFAVPDMANRVLFGSTLILFFMGFINFPKAGVPASQEVSPEKMKKDE